MDEDDCRIIELPYRFGQIVYHVIRNERIAGMVTAFNARPNRLTVGVTWGDSLQEVYHYPYELSAEYQPLNPES